MKGYISKMSRLITQLTAVNGKQDLEELVKNVEGLKSVLDKARQVVKI